MPKSQQPIEGQKIMLDGILSNPNHCVIDVGAGDGRWGRLLKGKVQRLIAIEAWGKYVERYHLRDIYDEVFVEDAKNFQAWDDFDVVILGDVLEHLHRSDALKLIETLKKTKVKVFLTVPITLCPQDGMVYDNPYETHQDQWTHGELEAVGWKQLHQGLNPKGLVSIGTYVLNSGGTE